MSRQTAVDRLRLVGNQRAAATIEGEDLLLRAGAGTGKTRTLVGRYLTLLESGASPRNIAAITFTEKAAREMRNRIRQAIEQQAAQADPGRTEQLRELAGSMDAARIGTIHSLCAEILRTHPAQAGVDPEFEVMDEGEAAILQWEVVERAMAEVAEDPETAAIYRYFSVWSLRRMLVDMLTDRLDVGQAVANREDATPPGSVLLDALSTFVESDGAREPIEALSELQSGGYFETEATGTMASMAQEFLDSWNNFVDAVDQGRVVPACTALFQARRRMQRGVGRTDGPARPAVEGWIAAYDRDVDPWLGGRSKSDPPPVAELEAECRRVDELAMRAFERAEGLYQAALSERSALDFDALEAGALQLLHQPAIAESWRAKLDHVLVDEFQDTNARQRRMIEALVSDRPGKLFVVGDAQQSIYRFRGADVAVFRQLGEAITERGRALALDKTYRQHPALLAALDELLAPAFDDGVPNRPYRVPYHRLQSNRDPDSVRAEPPYVEFVLGLGENAEAGRPVAAAALAARLRSLKDAGEIEVWDEVALLFRASTGFPWYEDAFEAAAIPYVTIAGRGFFDRPEIREIVNMLRALAEPWNEAAMAGLLRSAAIGMSDAGVFYLRRSPDGLRPLADAVRSQVLEDPEDETARQRAVAFMDDLRPVVDRLPVVELLKKIIDWTDARAMLAAVGERAWANLDKLLDDARDSELTRVREFLAYLDVLKNVGVRQGEAPADVQGAVRLMTIHKAKGLEFPTVVLADAGYAGRGGRRAYYPIAGYGVAVRADQLDQTSLVYRWAKAEDDERERAEESRLLYVALTRAADRALISGHLTMRASGPAAPGWLGDLLSAAGLDPSSMASEPNRLGAYQSAGRFGWLVHSQVAAPTPASTSVQIDWPTDHGLPLYAPIERLPAEDTDDDFDEDPARDWRATGRWRPPASVVGVLVHRAIERWAFPPDPRLDRLLEASAFGEGLVEPRQQARAISTAHELLERFKAHPIWQAIDASPERFHELPYTYQPAGWKPDSGAFDLLFRADDGWKLLDFKTDRLENEDDLQRAIDKHRPQMDRYRRAADSLLDQPVQVALVFLDYRDQVQVTTLAGDDSPQGPGSSRQRR